MGENIAPFLEFVNDWFTILNVSSLTLEIRFIDSRKAVMRLETEEMRRNSNFLENIAKLMNEWANKKFTKGTKFNSDTMKAVHKSSITKTKAIPNLLMTSRNQNLGLDYICTAKSANLNSDHEEEFFEAKPLLGHIAW